ncbi:MAG: glycosyltransferase family 4 protein [Deltaproteobacteria bacterium]|nr:glycosyltransferase family 4 protein [Deltaproteobacteria bacterium]
MPVIIDFDIKRLVDASVSRKPYQGITRYALRLFEALRDLGDEVVINPVYLHPLDPQRIGVQKAVTETFGLDAVSTLFGESVNTLWERHPVAGSLLRLINGLERRFGGDQNRLVGRALGSLQRQLVPKSFGTSESSSIGGQIFHSPVNPLPPRRLTKNHARVVTVHDCLFLKFPEFYPNPGQVPAIRRTLDSIDPSTDFVVCDSENSRRDLHSYLDIDPSRTTVVPLSADPQFFDPDTEKARRRLDSLGVTPGEYLLALAQSEPRKNIPKMVEAYLRARGEDSTPEVDLVLVTWESHRIPLLSTLEDQGLMRDSIKIITDVDDATLSGLYGLATALVYAPLYEGFGIPPLEAMASGCPVIVADNSSLPEVVGEAGIYVDAEDVQSIAVAITELVADAQRQSHLRELGLAHAAGFSWQRTAQMTLDFYQEMLETDDNSEK